MRFRRYPSMKGSEVEWIGDMPSHWRLERFKYLFEERNERGFPNEPLLAATQTRGVVRKEDYENRTVMALKDLENLKLVRVGDFVISLRSFEGGIEYAHVQGIISPAYTILRPRNDVVRGYYARLFKSPSFIENLNLYTTGIRDGQNIDYKAFRHSLVPVPPVDEQKAIAEFLDRRVEQLDSLVKKGQLFVERLQEYRQALITQAVTKGLDPNVPMKNSGIKWIGDVPEHWDITPLKHVVSCLDGRRVPLNAEQRSHMQGDIPYWGANGIVDYVNDWLFDEVLVLLGEDGAPFLDPLRDVAFTVEGKVWVNNHIHVLRPGNKVNHRFLMHALNAVDYYDYIDGSTRDKLTQSNMNRIRLPLPPKSEQDLIASFLDKKTQAIDTLIETKLLLVDRLQEYRQALITAAVTGKIDVRRDQRERTNIQDVC